MRHPDWQSQRLGSVAEVIDPHPSHRAPPVFDQGIPFVGIGDISEDGQIDVSSARSVSPLIAAEHRLRYTVAAGDIGFGRVATVGKVIRFDNYAFDFTLSPTLALIKPNGIDRTFLIQYLQSQVFDVAASRLLTGTTRSSLGIQLLRKLDVTAPACIKEQCAIGAVLETLDTTIRQTEAIIDKLKQVKQGLLHDLLTRGIDANGELRPPQSEAPHLYKESPLGWIPREWTTAPLGELAEVDRGKFTHRPRNDPAFYGGRYPFIQTGDVANAVGGYVSTYSQTLSERGINVSQEFPAGTVAITIAANIADTAILAIPMYFPDSVVGAIVAPSASIRFVELSVRRAKPQLNARAPQSAQKNINLQDLRPMLIGLPSKAEQDAIAERYEAVQLRLDAEDAAARKLREAKSGLMDDLLTGRVRVTPLLQGQAD